MNNNLNLGQLIALLIPLVLVELGLLGFALFDLVKRKRVRGGNKWLWGIIIVVVEIFGPILYFVLGREEE
ncbi:MAG: PLD nuclease N-terminal domain-containing protein [Chloroflexi bacterium]|jgi:hypothetical protein|nr:PLD nuclease N-terminal domain-containing protein [Chloroflexota bacterium]